MRLFKGVGFFSCESKKTYLEPAEDSFLNVPKLDGAVLYDFLDPVNLQPDAEVVVDGGEQLVEGDGVAKLNFEGLL